ncbi:MAG: c-type cytochrome [Myxococcales bacterium]|nr:c-type cytochrome [Myxococcales bacterium]
MLHATPRHAVSVLLACVLVGGCNQPTTSGPRADVVAWPEGDVARGKQAFQDLGCNSCHRVEGVADLPPPSAQPPVEVTLGGKHTQARTQAELFTAVVNPDHDLAPDHPKKDVCTTGDCSRMGDYAWTMTVAQLVDVIAFIESTHPR